MLHCKEGVDLLAMLCYTFLLKVIVPTIWPLCSWFVRFKMVLVMMMVIEIVMVMVIVIIVMMKMIVVMSMVMVIVMVVVMLIVGCVRHQCCSASLQRRC